MTGLAELHRAARLRLAEGGIEEPAIDARLLVEHVSGTTRLDLIRHPNQAVDAAAESALLEALERRLGGEPVHRIIGFRDFRGLRLRLSQATLEPRDDTEALVALVLEMLDEAGAGSKSMRALDLGTGTGAIALSLLDALPSLTVLATDVAHGALATARANADLLGLGERLSTAQGPWFAPVSGSFDAIVSNPPYIRSADIPSLSREVRDHEPLAALDGGPDGLDAYRAIARGAARHLEPQGFLAVEIGHDQRADVGTIFSEDGWTCIAERCDLGGHVRALAFGRR